MKRITLITIINISFCLLASGQISKNITTSLSDIEIEKIGEYDKISITNEFHATDIVGQPELPIYYKSFVIPRDAQLNGVSVNSVNKQKVKGSFNVFPAQPQNFPLNLL